MPPRKDAEAGTVDEQSAAAIGNVDPKMIADVATVQELVLKQQEMIKQLASEVDALRTQKADAPVVPQQAVYEPPVLREGHRRYASRYTEHTMMRVGTGHEMHGGQAVPVPIITGKPIDFNGGVYETGDPDEIEFIESHPDYGILVWEDSTAVRRTSQVEVTDGLKHTATTPRVPLSAPMGQ